MCVGVGGDGGDGVVCDCEVCVNCECKGVWDDDDDVCVCEFV